MLLYSQIMLHKTKTKPVGKLKLQPELLDSVETKVFWKDFYKCSISPCILGNPQLTDWMIKMQTFIFGLKDKEVSKWASTFLWIRSNFPNLCFLTKHKTKEVLYRSMNRRFHNLQTSSFLLSIFKVTCLERNAWNKWSCPLLPFLWCWKSSWVD